MNSTANAKYIDPASPDAQNPACLGTAAPIQLPEDSGDHGGPPARVTDRRFVVAALMLIMVLASMEMTVTSTAMPTIIGELHGLEHYSWVASLYLLAATVTMPLYGRLADVWGRKRVVIAATALFTVASVLAAMSHSMLQLILFRGLQGLGAGGIMPVVLTIIGDLFTLKERARIQGLFSSVWGLSSLAGPALGAFLVHTLGWRWVFLVNLPAGAMGLAILSWKYHDHQKPHSTVLDLPGIALLGVASLAVLSLVSSLGPGGWSNASSIALFAVFVVGLVLFLLQERRTSNPVMPPALFLRRDIGPSILAMFFFGIVFMSLDTYVPLYVQGGLGGGAAAAAGVVTPVMLTWALSNMLSAPLLVRWGFRTTALTGSTLILLGMVGLLLGAYFAVPRWALTAILSMTGFGFGWASMSFLLGAQNAVGYQQRGIVTSSVSFFRTIGGAVGIGVFGATFNGLSYQRLRSLEAQGIAPAAALDPAQQATLPDAAIALVREVIASSLIWVFLGMLLIAAIQLFITFWLPRQKAQPSAPIEHASFD
jgi:Na+/melibiose symporter-like transporter